MELEKIIPDWAWGMNCAVTVADADCRIIYMNARSRETYQKHGDLIGKSLIDCHNPRSVEIIRNILATGGQNVYTIEKKGVHKLIFQSAWRLEDGTVGGIVEISIVTPEDMPHYVRS